MARRRLHYTNRRGTGTIVILVIVIAMAILGTMLLFMAIGDSTAEDMSKTSLYNAAVVTESGVNLVSGIMPIFIWLAVIGVLVVALVFVYKAFIKRRR